jgi:hypothetical protein
MGDEEWDGWSRFAYSFLEGSVDFRFAWENNREFYSDKYRELVDKLYKQAVQRLS